MMTRTYRAEVIGQFDRVAGALRQQLLDQQPAHDVFSTAFSERGCLTYSPALTRFSVRYLLHIHAPTAVAADQSAQDEALLRTFVLLEGFAGGALPTKDLRVSLTCLEDLKPRR